MKRGRAPPNGSPRRRRRVGVSASSSFTTSGTNHSWYIGEDIAANHMSQSSRRWYGAYCGGRRRTSPGFALNSYSRHAVLGVSTGSSVPSTTTSERSFVVEPKAPYVFTRFRGSQLVVVSWCRERGLRARRWLDVT